MGKLDIAAGYGTPETSRRDSLQRYRGLTVSERPAHLENKAA
jgi:hypothetical protein